MITGEILRGYLEDSLGEAETAHVERELRASEELRKKLREMMEVQDRGEHSVGAVWRRHRLTCPTREEMGSYLLDALDPALRDYIRFHLEKVGCPFCQANRDDLQHQDRDAVPAREKCRKIFDSGSGLLKRGAK